jgi:flavin reductase (DIM6/NTAB) family NADH-FMN oxidoreductase RutF
LDETALAFRDAMSRWASGLTVVSAEHDGVRVGLVASSFTSVSADPPTVLVCIDKRSRSLPTIDNAGAFAVNVLSSEQDHAFRVFAGMAGDVPDKFASCGETIQPRISGAPILGNSLAWFDCRIVGRYEGGTSHVILVGEVLACGAATDASATPLLYFSRGTRRLASL